MAVRAGSLEGLAMSFKFWEGKRVFLTGHTGFKGSWLLLWLEQLGAKVTGFSLNPPTEPSLFNLIKANSGSLSLIGDIRVADKLKEAMINAEPEIVIHMAAQSLVRQSYNDPLDTYTTNVIGSVNVLEAVRSCSTVRAVVMITSDKCYENKEWQWGYREIDPMGGYDPYSNSKACVELITAAYRNSFFNTNNYSKHRTAIATVRAGNVIGGGDWAADRLIPDIVHSIKAGVPLKIRNPFAIRPWQHVLEPLSGYLLLAEKLYSSGPNFAKGWNFGANEEDARTVQWVVEKLISHWGVQATWEADASIHVHEASYLKLDCSQAKAELGWYPRWCLEEGLSYLVKWYKSYFNGENMFEITKQQINSFVETKAIFGKV